MLKKKKRALWRDLNRYTKDLNKEVAYKRGWPGQEHVANLSKNGRKAPSI